MKCKIIKLILGFSFLEFLCAIKIILMDKMVILNNVGIAKAKV